MNIQKEIVEHYNEKVSKRVDTRIRRRITYWQMRVDLGVYIAAIILLGIFTGNAAFFVLAIFIATMGALAVGISCSGVRVHWDSYFVPIGIFSFLVPTLEIKKEKKKVAITPKSLAEPSIYSRAFCYYSDKLVNDYDYIIKSITNKIQECNSHLESTNAFLSNPNLEDRQELAQLLKTKIEGHLQILQEQKDSAELGQAELKKELGQLRASIDQRESLYGLAATYNLVVSTEEDIALFSKSLERLNQIKQEVFVKINTEKELQVLNLKALS